MRCNAESASENAIAAVRLAAVKTSFWMVRGSDAHDELLGKLDAEDVSMKLREAFPPFRRPDVWFAAH
jgi:hypothetical protein